MAVNWQNVGLRLKTLGPDGKYLPVITGRESDEDLREMVLQMSQSCPLNLACLHCPFRILQGLSYASLNKTVAGLDRTGCLELFALESACRNQVAAQCLHKPKSQFGPASPGTAPAE
jgi:hypothetical protein